MSMEDYKKLVNRLREEPKDSRNAVLSIYDLCIDASYAIEILLDKLKYAEGERDVVTKRMIELEQEVCQLKSRLAAYEDTGLEPEEIKELRQLCTDEVAELARTLHRAIESGEVDRIRDLLQAEQAGRLVMLPCKVGDTVYEISNNTDACNSCQHYEGIYGSGESWCTQIDDVDLRSYPNIAEKPLCEKQFMEVVEHKPEIDWIFTHRNDFGKTVFLTREEAEAALAGKGGEG